MDGDEEVHYQMVDHSCGVCNRRRRKKHQLKDHRTGYIRIPKMFLDRKKEARYTGY